MSHPAPIRPSQDVLQHVERLQYKAADPSSSVWVAASAGTGKTKVLTDRMLHLLLKGVQAERILCLTFTKAAAAEMSNRLLEKLSLWSRLPQDDLIASLKNLVGHAVPLDALSRARRLYTEVLDLPRGMRIQTIHAFCQSILAKFPLEADLNPSFKILDDRETKALKEQVFEDLVGEQSQAILDDLNTALHHLSVPKFKSCLEDCLAAHDRLKDWTYDTRTIDADPLQTFLDAQQGRLDLLKQVGHILSEGSITDKARGEGLISWCLKSTEERRKSFDAFKLLFLTTKGEPRAKLITQKLEQKEPFCVEILYRELGLLMGTLEAQVRLKIDRFTRAMHRLTVHFSTLFSKGKESAGRLDYDDLINKTLSLLKKPGIAPWILFKLDQHIDHILVDEAQDTNPEQWGIIKAVVDDLCAGAGRDGTQERSLFIVGDAKQSIYSFQKADPAVFEAIRKHFATGLSAQNKWQEIDLDTSFRSSAPVLQVVDQTFKTLDTLLPYGDLNKELNHKVFRENALGGVELWPLAVPGAEDENAPWSMPLERLYKVEPRTQVVRMVAHKIHTWITQGACLTNSGKPVQAKDFLILVRKRGHFMEEIVTALKQLHIPVAGVDRMILNHQLVIKDLIALGQFLVDPTNDLNLACVLKGPFIRCTEEYLFTLAHNRRESIWSSLPQGHHRDRLSFLITLAQNKTPYTFYQTLLEVHGFRKTLLSQLGIEVDETIDEFLNQLHLFEKTHIPSLASFLAWFRHDEVDLKRDLQDLGRNEVRVMTVHGSKGLQAPIVILPDAFQAPRDLPTVLFDAKDNPIILPDTKNLPEDIKELRDHAQNLRDLEYKRLLYVAMTRAEDRLYVGGWLTRQSAEVLSWYDMIKSALLTLPETTAFSFKEEGGWDDQGLRFENQRPLSLLAPMKQDQSPYPPCPLWVTTPLSTPDSTSWTSPSSQPHHPTMPHDLAHPSSDLSAKDRGTAIHGLLERLPKVAPIHYESVATDYLTTLGLPPETHSELLQEALSVLTNPDLRFIIEDGIAEIALTSRTESGAYISGRIDRLVVTDDTVHIIDYKTDRWVPSDPMAVPQNYKDQLNAYKTMVTKIYPNHTIRCAFLWTKTPQLMYV